MQIALVSGTLMATGTRGTASLGTCRQNCTSVLKVDKKGGTELSVRKHRKIDLWLSVILFKLGPLRISVFLFMK